MALRRITLHVDDGDLLVIKEAAIRLGVPEGELIREGIHRIAAAHRLRDEPFVSDDETFDLGEPTGLPIFDSGDASFAERGDGILGESASTEGTTPRG